MGEVEYTFELAGTIRPVALIPRNESAFAFICAAADGRADALGRVAAIREGDAGIDRFGRVVEHLWYAYGASTDRDRYTYGYDRASNRLYRENTLTTRRDELYGYDQLNRLVEFARGELNANKDGIMGTAAKAEEWGLDTTGNWDAFLQKTSSTTDLDQARTHNPVNEITAITAATGTDWADPVHDRAGNMTTITKPASLADGLTATCDAWNRLVEVKDGATVIARYEYDGVNRRIKSRIDSSAPSNPTGIDTYVHYYHNSAWQILETRQSDTPSAQPETLQPKHQYVWSQRYIDAAVLRDENTGTNGLCDDQRLYYLNDANFNVTALLDTSGPAVERYVYSPYGVVTIYDATWTNTRSTSSYANVTLYTGRELDVQTGLYYYRNRYYSAELGRFVSRDLIAYDGGGLNVFRYGRNNPVRLMDPFGLVDCNADHEGARRGVASDTALSPGNNNSPDFVDGALNLLAILSAFSDVPTPGGGRFTSLGQLLRQLDPTSPSGVKIAAKLARLQNFKFLTRQTMGQASVWTKVQCEECRCTNWFQFIRGRTRWQWVAVGNPKWVQCDLAETDWGRNQHARRGRVHHAIRERALTFEFLTPNDVVNVKSQCAKQAEESCER